MKVEKDEIREFAETAENRWGKWAKVLVGALVGALVAGGVLTLSGCGASVTVASEQGMIQVSSDGKVVIVPGVVQERKK